MAPKRAASPGPSSDRKKAKTSSDEPLSAIPRRQSLIVKLPLQDPLRDYKAKVDEANQQCPAYAFRGFWRGSGGNAALNTDQAITPHAFYKRPGPSSLFDIPQHIAAGLARDHWNGRPIDSPFSSWSQSIRTAFDFALRDGRPGSYLAIVDANRLPSKYNLMLHTSLLDCLGPGIPVDPHELLAFGVIKGEGFRDISIQAILDCMPVSPGTSIGTRWAMDNIIAQQDFATILKVASLFGPDFLLPMAIALSTYRLTRSLEGFAVPLSKGPVDLAISEHPLERLSNALFQLLKSEVPAAWARDPAVMDPGTHELASR